MKKKTLITWCVRGGEVFLCGGTKHLEAVYWVSIGQKWSVLNGTESVLGGTNC